MRNAFDGVALAVGPVVHGINAPGIAGAVVGRVHDAVHDGVAQIDVGAAMSILARNTREPSGNAPSFICAKRSRFSSMERSRYGLFLPGSVSVPRFSRISSAVWSSTYAKPFWTSATAQS